MTHKNQNRIQTHTGHTWWVFGVFGTFTVSALLLVSLSFLTATQTNAAPNYQMNYQGKLTNASNIAVADGTYNMRFWLLASSTVATTSALWTESLTGVNRVQVTNGLFSVMLGSTTPLTGVDFNQTLFLGVEIGSTTGSAVWDGEMSPRKVLGTVPSAFEANKLDGLDSTQFVRTDATSSIATSSASTLLTLTQSGVGDILNIFDGTTEVFTMTDGGRMGLGTTSPSRLFTMQGGDFWLGGNMTATGTAVFNALTVSASSTLGYASTTALTVAGTSYLNGTIDTALTQGVLTTNSTGIVSASTTIGDSYISDALTLGTGSSINFSNTTESGLLSGLSGLSVSGSSTIGGGTGATGLTINGTATSTNLKVTALTASRMVMTGADKLLTTTGTSQYLIDSLSDETGTGVAVFSASPIFTGTAQFAGLTVSASSTLGFASTTALTVTNNAYLNTFTATAGTTTNATSTNLRVSGLFTLGGDALTDITGNGLQNSSNVLTCITATGAAFGCLTSTDWTTFMGKVASSSIDTSSELATLVTDETGTGSLVFSASPTFTGTPTFANLYMSPTGTSTLGYASSTALTVANNAYLNTFTATAGTTTNATSTNLAVTTFKIGNDVITDITGTNLSVTNGILSAASTADGVSNWSYNGTRLTPTSTTAGISVNASSTIGGGTGATGLTINGGATTTGNAYFGGNVGIGTTSLSTKLSVVGTTTIFSEQEQNSGRIYHNGTSFVFENNDSNAVVDERIKFAYRDSNGNPASFVIDSAGQFKTTTSLRFVVSNIQVAAITGGGWQSPSNKQFLWSSDPNPAGGPDVGLARSSAGVLKVTNGSTGDGSLIIGGNVGIGTTTPWAKLSIQNSYGNTASLFDIATTTSSAFATSSIFRVNHDGKVGIGSSTPSKTLSITGDMALSGGFFDTASTSGSNGQYLMSTGTSTRWTTVTASGDGVSNWSYNGSRLSPSTTVGIGIFASSTIGGGTGATGLTINGGATTTGNAYFGGTLGIGTTSPSAKLSLTGTAGNTSLFAFASSTGSNLLTLDARGTLNFGTTTDANIFMNGGGTTTNPLASLRNVAIGNQAFSYYGTNANNNVALGYQALYGSSSVLMTGDDNFAVGYQALYKNTTGGSNNAQGYKALSSNTTGSYNIALGYQALLNNTTGTDNLAQGINALATNSTGNYNIAQGNNALSVNTNGSYNIAQGYLTLANNITGGNNIAQGNASLRLNTTGSSSIAQGYESLYSNTTGSYNTAIGNRAGYSMTTGSFNNALGYQAGYNMTTGTSTLFLGAGADTLNGTISSSTALGAGALLKLSNTMVLGGTGANNVNIVTGTSSPWAKLSIQNNYGSTTALFDIATTTSSAFATSSIFRVNHDGNVGIGTTTPSARLTMDRSGVTGSTTVAGIKQYFNFTNSTLSAVNYGDETYITSVPTATSTLVGKMIRIADTSALGNTVRGLEVQAGRGTNTKGENTALSGYGRTFGVRGSTSGDAGDTYLPAGIFAESEGTTQGNALRAYSGTITTENLAYFFHDTSNFTGTGLRMDFGNAGGSFAATSSSAKFIDLKVGGTSKFTIAANGSTTIGDGVVNASLRIPYGGICVDNDGSCISTTTGQIRSVTSALGNSDLAEMYFSSQTLQTGEIVSLSGGLSIRRAEDGTEKDIIGVVSTKPGMTLGFDDTSLVSGEGGYPVGLKGRVPVKLSVENGPIKKGDRIALSSIPGIGMKAEEGDRVVGIALEDYDGTRAYSDGFLNQFGDDMLKERMVLRTKLDPHTQDGCYTGGGNPLGDKPCVAKTVTKTTVTTENPEPTRAEMMNELAHIEAVTTVTKDGVQTSVGQAIMFIELSWYQSDQTRMMLSELSTTTALFENGETLWSRIKALASNFVDGVLSITGLKADRVEITDELCVDGVCVNADDLRAILQSTRGGSTGGHTSEEGDTEGRETEKVEVTEVDEHTSVSSGDGEVNASHSEVSHEVVSPTGTEEIPEIETPEVPETSIEPISIPETVTEPII